jgi:hypothetical protein
VTNRSGAKAYFFRSLRISFKTAGGVLISLGLDQHPSASVDFQIDLVEMPSRIRLQATLA